jgi:hypothetical protein
MVPLAPRTTLAGAGATSKDRYPRPLASAGAAKSSLVSR